MYKKRLIALLEGLECRHIDKLIEKSSDHLKVVGIKIAKYAKIGAESDVAILTSQCSGLAKSVEKAQVKVEGK